jgi:hypothetical protein
MDQLYEAVASEQQSQQYQHRHGQGQQVSPNQIIHNNHQHQNAIQIGAKRRRAASISTEDAHAMLNGLVLDCGHEHGGGGGGGGGVIKSEVYSGGKY